MMIKILVAVHGFEPRGWVDRAVRALPPAPPTTVRVLVVLDAPSPPFTSLLPAARRRYAAARAEWRRLTEAQAESSVALLAAALPAPPEVERVVAGDGDPGKAIVHHARRWGADLVVVGRDTRGWLDRALLRAVHERVVDHSPCAVVVAPAETSPAPDPIQVGRRRFVRRWRAAMGGD